MLLKHFYQKSENGSTTNTATVTDTKNVKHPQKTFEHILKASHSLQTNDIINRRFSQNIQARGAY